MGPEPVVEIRPGPTRALPPRPVDPQPRPGQAEGGGDGPGPRVVGPGRIERGYRTRIEELERTVETAALVERGSAKLLDRVEGELTRERKSLAEARQQANRLMVGLGALQRENELLRARVLELEGGAPAQLEPAAPAGRRSTRKTGSRRSRRSQGPAAASGPASAARPRTRTRIPARTPEDPRPRLTTGSVPPDPLTPPSRAVRDTPDGGCSSGG